MPVLLQHFTEHKKENKDLSFIKFLEIHYLHGSPKDEDYDKDLKLPFKTITNTNVTSVSICTPIPNFKQNPLVYFKNNKHQFSNYSFSYTSTFLSSIWQPPKSC